MFDYAGDPDYSDIYEAIQSGKADLTKPSLSLFSICNDNLVWMDWKLRPRVCVPKQYWAMILHEFHDTPLGVHLGSDKTYHTVRHTYIWPHMRHHVEQYVHLCDSPEK